MSTEGKPLVGVIMGSKSDWETMRHADEVLSRFEILEDTRHAGRGVHPRAPLIVPLATIGGELKQLRVWAVNVLPRSIAHAVKRLPAKMQLPEPTFCVRHRRIGLQFLLHIRCQPGRYPT